MYPIDSICSSSPHHSLTGREKALQTKRHKMFLALPVELRFYRLKVHFSTKVVNGLACITNLLLPVKLQRKMLYLIMMQHPSHPPTGKSQGHAANLLIHQNYFKESR